MKVRLKGPSAAQYNVGGRFLQGESIHDLSEKEIKNHKDVIEEIFGKLKKESKKHTEKELFKLTKEDQMKLLEELGVKKVPRLEKDRVKAILEAQK